MKIEHELKAFGPQSDASPIALEQAQAYTWRLATTHYENFPVVTKLVPRRLRPHFANIYAYCRWSDDLADETVDPLAALRLLDWWQGELEACYEGRCVHPVMVALSSTIQRFSIPKQPFVDLLTAFRRDQTQTRYATFTDLLDYCRCSANPVGRLVLYLCERATLERFALSDDICTGLQLINFWQDVAVDRRKGRIYLPEEDLDRFGVDVEEIDSHRFSKRFANLLRFEVERAEKRLRQGLPLARRLPGRLRMTIAMFGHGGLAIARKIRQLGYNVQEHRPVLRKRDFPGIALRALLTSIPR